MGRSFVRKPENLCPLRKKAIGVGRFPVRRIIEVAGTDCQRMRWRQAQPLMGRGVLAPAGKAEGRDTMHAGRLRPAWGALISWLTLLAALRRQRRGLLFELVLHLEHCDH